MNYIYHDFEYRQNGRQLICACFWRRDGFEGEKVALDLRDPIAGRAALAALKARWNGPETIWLTYSGMAEIGSWIVAGIDIDDMDFIDLAAEARQITGSHASYYTKKANLLRTLEMFGIPTRGTVAAKETCRNLILGTAQYSEAEWAMILDYCASDVEPLPALWHAIQRVHRQKERLYHVRAAVYRADYLKASAILEHRSPGFPMDVAALTRMCANQKLVRNTLAALANKKYGEVYRYNEAKDSYHFSFAGLQGFIRKLPYPVFWDRTPSGRLKMSEDYLDEFVRKNQEFEELRDTKILLDQLKTSDLRTLLDGNFIRGTNVPYSTITGRNQPLTSRGFVFNLPPWLRLLVRPEPHHVIIGADWSQQEIVIGAALSGDRALAAALATGDVYLALAKMAGAVPQDATKHTHEPERNLYKSAQLGIGYGMGDRTLGKRIYLDLAAGETPITMAEASRRACDILKWHKRTFTDYWDFIRREIHIARVQGWLQTKDGWTLFVDQNTRATQIQNWPMQANAAVILRCAVKLLADEPAIKLVCSLHDALYIYAHERDKDAHMAILLRCMREATAMVMRATKLPLPIAIETKVFTHASGFTDRRGTATYAHISKILDAAEAAGQLNIGVT